VIVSGGLAWRRMGEQVRRASQTVVWPRVFSMMPPVFRKRRWRVPGVAVA
jgi:hypothetical protein